MVDSNRRDSIDTTIRFFSAKVKYSRMAGSSFLHWTQLFRFNRWSVMMELEKVIYEISRVWINIDGS